MTSDGLTVVCCGATSIGLVEILCRLEPLRQAIDAHRDEVTISARRQRTEMIGGLSSGGPGERRLSQASV
jgi:hypothetical protein